MVKTKQFNNFIITFGAMCLVFAFFMQTVKAKETININGMTFVVGEHHPEKRIHPNKKKYKNPKALEVHKQPKHGRRLRLEETEEYIEARPELKSINNNTNTNLVGNAFVQNSIYPLEMTSGAHVTVGGVWTNASSRVLKENIVGIDDDVSLDTVLNLEPVTYNYKVQPGETYAGFVAEDVPELVATSDRSSLSPMDIVAVVVGSIKSIWAKIVSIQESILNIFERLAVIENKLGIKNEKEPEKKDIVLENYLTEDIENKSEEVDSVKEDDFKIEEEIGGKVVDKFKENEKEQAENIKPDETKDSGIVEVVEDDNNKDSNKDKEGMGSKGEDFSSKETSVDSGIEKTNIKLPEENNEKVAGRVDKNTKMKISEPEDLSKENNQDVDDEVVDEVKKDGDS